MTLANLNKCTIAVIGLGYVGLPLAVEFGKTLICKRSHKKLDRKVIGYDINQKRINELKKGFDSTKELSSNEIDSAIYLTFTSKIQDIMKADIFIVTVPTPIDNNNKPDLTIIKNATISIGKILKKRKKHNTTTDPVVIYESTVFPGLTEEVCAPLLEEYSNLTLNRNLFCGYSPERINPGDKIHSLNNIIKVTSGSSEETKILVDNLYGSIIKAGTFIASSIKVAEASKVIENTQRDINIALVNEFSIIFNKIGIDTEEVLKASGTKWNFLNFKPGIVGGHCIGVDPYYLAYKSKQLRYTPKVILAGRKVNNDMSVYITNKIFKEAKRRGNSLIESKVLVLGLTFKENCPDTRNSKVFDIINILNDKNMCVDIVDPCINLADFENINKDYSLENNINYAKKYNIIIAAVSHNWFKNLSLEKWKSILENKGFIYDIKGFVPKQMKPMRL